jgi:hypothetical protein
MLSNEKQKVNSIQEENLQLSQAMSSLQLDFEREKIEKKKLQEKYDFQLSRGDSMTRSSSSTDFHSNVRQSPDPFSSRFYNEGTNETEQLRTRIAALSQSLLEKQSLINGLSADKQLMQINVERLQAQIQNVTRNSDAFAIEGLCAQSGT